MSMKFLRALLGKLWKKWLRVAQVIGNFQAQLILTAFYFLVFAPLGIIYRLFADPLRLRLGQDKRSNFQNWEHPKEDLEQARRQY